MDIKQIQSFGGFVTRVLFKKEIPVRRPVLKPAEEWANPDEPEKTGEFVEDTLTAHVRKRSSADFLEMVQATDRDKAHIAILRCICHEDGTEVFESLAQCKQLEEWLFIPLMLAVNEVNQFGLKNSQPKTSSGTSLPSSSGVRSRKLKRVAPKKSDLTGSPTGTDAAP
jgi:hypothetical protein